MRIAFVDDDALERKKILPLLLQGFQNYHLPIQQLDVYKNGASFLEAWKTHDYDLVILDIYMGDFSGMDVAKKIRKQNKETRIVFCSTSNDFANESYEVDASYYIQKPVTQRSILQMMERLNIEDYEQRKFITLPDGQPLILRNVIYTQYHNHQVEIITKKGPTITTWMAQSTLVELLSPHDYYLPCNSGSIVNLWEVSELKNDVFVMSDASCIPISRRRKSTVNTIYRNFLLHAVKEHR